MRILVTGAAGFIGSHLAERLVRDGHTVRGLDCLTEYYDRSLKQTNVERLREHGVQVWPLDLAEAPLAAPLQDIQVVYHLAAQPGLSAHIPNHTFVRNNVKATERLLAVLEEHPTLEAFVLASSSSVYGAEATGDEEAPLSPVSTYGRTKRRAEQLVRASAKTNAWAATILRLFSVYGPRERPDKLFHKAIRCVQTDQAFPLYEGSGEHRRSFTYVEDAVDGLVAVLDRIQHCAGETINLGNPRTASTRRVLELIEDVAGRPLHIERAAARAGDQSHTRADIRKAQRLLDFSPGTPLREGIAAEMAWMKERAPRMRPT